MKIFKQISTRLGHERPAMIDLLEELVCIQSGTQNKKGVDLVGRVIQREMETLGFSCTTIRQSKFGNHILARSPRFKPGKKQMLIVGHMDTVFPVDTDFNFFRQDDAFSYGPGVADMKGGLVVGMFALKVLLAHQLLSDTNICFFFNSDEEVGSPSSRKCIQEEADKSYIGLVLEAGGVNNEIVTGRKGYISAKLSVEGRDGHAAFAGPDKASAIQELAHKIIAIEGLNQPEKGISANVGSITGGIGPNTVAKCAGANIDFRYLIPEDYQWLVSRIREICEAPVVPGTRTSIEIVSSRAPMKETSAHTALFEHVRKIGQGFDYHVKPQLRYGVSDANCIAERGVPVIDGLGPIGSRDHSEDEFIFTQSLVDRSLLLALFIMDLAEGKKI